MSFLTLPGGIPGEFKKAVISFWFRVPLRTLQDVAIDKGNENVKAAGNPHYVFPRMLGIVPLMTFGALNTGYQLDSNSPRGDQTWTETTIGFSHCSYGTPVVVGGTGSTGVTSVKAGDYLANPSFIGIETGAWDGSTGGGPISTNLHIRLQMGDNGSGEAVVLNDIIDHSSWTLLDASWSSTDGCGPPPTDTAFSNLVGECLTDYDYPGGEWTQTITHEDQTALVTLAHGPEEFEAGYNLEVKPDLWHHVLISFDLDLHGQAMVGTGTKSMIDKPQCSEGSGQPPPATIDTDGDSSIKNPCRMWIALDDVDRNGTDLFLNDQSVTGLGANDIVTSNVYLAAAKRKSIVTHDKTWAATGLIQLFSEVDDFVTPKYSYTPAPIPSEPLGIPCIPDLVQYNRHVEMAEFQMWTGVTLDTSSSTNRRAFISDTGKPVSPRQAEQLLGQKPDILLHGSGNWINGSNTGSIGIDATTGNKIPGGQFEPTGEIDSYRPNPSLNGPQGT